MLNLMADFSSMLAENPEIESVFSIFGVIYGISAILGILLYLFNAIGLMKMSNSLGLKKGWISFIPVANIYALGRVAQNYIKNDGRKSAKFGAVLLTLYIILFVFLVVFFILLGIALATVIELASGAVIDNTAMNIEMFSSFIPAIISYFVAFALAIAYTVVYYVAVYKIFDMFSNHAVLFIVLSIFFTFLVPIFIFAIRNGAPKRTYEERLGINLSNE